MSEPTKTTKKIKRSSSLSAAAKPGSEVLDGAAVEKPNAAQPASTADGSAKPQNQPLTDQTRQWSKMLASQNVAVVMAGTALVVAVIALAVSVVNYWQAADETGSSQLALSAAVNGFDQANLSKLGQRLDGLTELTKKNADNYESLQQKISSAIAIRPTDTPAITNLDDLMKRLAALEAANANQMAVADVTDSSAVQDSFDTGQNGLLVAAGLLAENLAGRDLEIWAGVLDDLQWPGVDAADRDIIRGAVRTPVDSRADLLSLGRLQLAPMVQSLNKADDGSGLLEQARARLANLIQLRRTGGGGGQPETVLASFKVALDNADFDAAFAAAAIWSSAGLDGLEPWLKAAQRRHDLDQAVNRLVAIFVTHVAGQS